MDHSRPGISKEKSTGWSWPHLVDRQSEKSPKSSSSMPSQRRSSAFSENSPDPKLIPLPNSSEADESARGRSEASTESETLTEDGQAMSDAVSQSIGALAGIDKWKNAASVSILITFWEKLDDKKKQPLVFNGGANAEAGSDNPDQSTASHPRSRLSIDSLAQKKDSVAFQVKYEESEEDEEDDKARLDEADVQSESKKGQSQLDASAAEQGARHKHDSKSDDTITSVPDTVTSWLTAPEPRNDSTEKDADGFGSENDSVTDTAPSFPPHENVRMGLGTHRSSSMFVEGQSVQGNDNAKDPTSDDTEANSQPPSVEAAKDQSVQGSDNSKELASDDPSVGTANDQGVQENDEAKASSDDDPATIALPSSNASTAIFEGSDGQVIEGKPNVAQHSAIREATRTSDWAFESPTVEEKLGEAQQTAINDHPAAKQSETPQNECYFAPRAPSFYIPEPPPTEDNQVFSTPAERPEGCEDSDTESTTRIPSGNVYGSNEAGPSNTVDTPKLEEGAGQVLGNDGSDGTPEPEGGSLAEKALAVSTRELNRIIVNVNSNASEKLLEKLLSKPQSPHCQKLQGRKCHLPQS
jgi:hypothetical protein